MLEEKDLFLGFDLSTQQLKIVSCYSDLSFHSKYTIEFDDEFGAKYGIKKGVISSPETGEVVTPVSVFLDALELLFDRMKKDQFPFEKVKSIGGSCQQHGTVYFTSRIGSLLSTMDKNWSSHLKEGFSFKTASNWQDRSTGEEIKAFDNVFGSPEKLCEMTGSKAHYRFSGLQMRRRALANDENWKSTRHLRLISSFLTTILSGQLCGIEISEACGTNLLTLKNSDWNDELLSLVAGKNSKIDNVSLQDQLNGSKIVREMVGDIDLHDHGRPIASYLVINYGFNPKCTIWPMTGDNMATIMSLPLARDDVLISMGTSTTTLLITDKYVPSVNYHMFKHPVCPDLYMGMLCYCNGALAREQVRDFINEKYNTSGWDKFNEIIDTKKTNNVGIYFPSGEIIPNVSACERRFTFSQSKLKELNTGKSDEDAIMIVESQALSCRMRMCPLLNESKDDSSVNEDLQEVTNSSYLKVDGVNYNLQEFNSRPNNVYYVGGTSQNASIVNKFDQVLGPRVQGFTVEISDACALGGCFRAIWGSADEGREFEKWLGTKFDFKSYVDPIKRTDDTDATWRSFMFKMGVLSLAETQLE